MNVNLPKLQWMRCLQFARCFSDLVAINRSMASTISLIRSSRVSTFSLMPNIKTQWSCQRLMRFSHSKGKRKILQPISVTSLPRKTKNMTKYSNPSQSKRKGQEYETLKSGNEAVECDQESERLTSVINRYSSRLSTLQADNENSRDMIKKLRFMRAKTIGKKYFKKPSLPNLLSWSAKEQIRFLHQTDPDIWSVQQLAEIFPTSKESIQQILKGKRKLHRPEDILQHDKEVEETWMHLGESVERKGDDAIDEDVYKSLKNSQNECLIANANGIRSLPNPALEAKYFKPKGPFSKIVSDCIDMKAGQNRESLKIIDESLRDKLQHLSRILSDAFDFNEMESIKGDTASESNQGWNSTEKGLRISGKSMLPQQHVRKSSSEEDSLPEEFGISKYKENLAATDVNMQPLKARHAIKDNLDLQRTNNRKDYSVTYISGDCVYDHEGNFLYRIP